MFDATDLYTPVWIDVRYTYARTHVRVSAGTRGVCVRRRNEEAPAWRGVGEDDEEVVVKDEGEEEGRGRKGQGGETPPESLSGRRI